MMLLFVHCGTTNKRFSSQSWDAKACIRILCSSQYLPSVRTEKIFDKVDVIAETLQRLRIKNDLLFTSDGIWPKLDDVTESGIVQAFSQELSLNEETVSRMQALAPGMRLYAPWRRTAGLPASCERLWTDGLWVPPVYVLGNVYVLPGISNLFNRMLSSVPVAWLGDVARRGRRVAFFERGEGDVAAGLIVVRRPCGEVAPRSYTTTNETAKDQWSR